MDYELFSSESVCAGHPDKICDQISDAVVDEALKIDPFSRVAVETLVTKNQVVMAGEVTCPKRLNYKSIARKVIKDLGYTKKKLNFTFKSPIEVFIHQQSPDINLGVKKGGAGDQGMMFGFATKETKNFMPLPIVLAQELVKKMDEVKKTSLSYLLPDGKSEVSVTYNHGKPEKVKTVVLAVPHDSKVDKEDVKKDLLEKVVKPVLEAHNQKPIAIEQLILNGTGRWKIGGPASDTGVTGRKIIIDTYGAMGRVGGGCFSGKDPTKVDRSAAYAARFIAKNIVAAKLADQCEVQLAYVIGYEDPIAQAIDTFDTARKSQKIINDFAWGLLDLSVEGILEGLKLRKPIYQKTASYGHFGWPEFPWEKIVV